MTAKLAEYIWLDGGTTPQLRSKTRVLAKDGARTPYFPPWSFDGSSTGQAEGADSDLTLVPVRVVPNPLRGDYLVLCEVLDAKGAPVPSNYRAKLLRAAGVAEDHELDPWFGIEQEYTLLKGGRPLGWPQDGFPGPQGPYYCGVGAGIACGRELVEEHLAACMEAGLLMYGANAEVMPGQWEFQVGHRGLPDDPNGDPLLVCDHLWLARWLLVRMAEERGITVSFDPKPIEGNWNGAGAHTNISTRHTRDRETGWTAIEDAANRLAMAHNAHIPEYGEGLERRLTGNHETAPIGEFRWGVADRGASVRVSRDVADKGYGYLEDRRPGANCDPYRVCARILETLCFKG